MDLISAPEYLDAPASVVRMSMMGTFQFAYNEFARSYPDFNVFHRYAASFPWRSHALWLLTQMVRWGQLRTPTDLRAIAEAAYLPEVYRLAASGLGIPAPLQDYKAEGLHAERGCLDVAGKALELGADCFMDGAVFNPRMPLANLPRPAALTDQAAWQRWLDVNAPWTSAQADQRVARELGPMVRASEQAPDDQQRRVSNR